MAWLKGSQEALVIEGIQESMRLSGLKIEMPPFGAYAGRRGLVSLMAFSMCDGASWARERAKLITLEEFFRTQGVGVIPHYVEFERLIMEAIKGRKDARVG